MNNKEYTITDFEKYLNQKQIEFTQYRKSGFDTVNRKLIELGRTLGDFPDVWKTKSNKVNGCTSKVYIYSNLVNDKVFFTGSSESEIVRGQLAILINGLNQLSPQVIVDETEQYINEFVKNSEVRFSLTISRANSLGNIYQFMKKKAEEFLNS